MTRTNKFLFIWAALATVIVIILFNIKSCGPGKVIMFNDTIEIVDTITVTKNFEVFIPTIVKVTEPSQTLIDTIPYVDSAFCKQLAIDHYSKKEYLDTLKTEQGDSIELILKSYVSANNLDSIRPTVRIKIPYVKEIIQPIPKTPWKLYIKANVGGGQSGFIGGGELLLTEGDGKRRPGRFCYSAAAYFTTFSEPVFLGGFGMKISFNKR